MTNCNNCQQEKTTTVVLPTYQAVGLGAPFAVFLLNAVRMESCAACGKEIATYIPDMEGLFHAVVFARSLESRKLNGDEIRFVRKAMGWKSKDLAKHLGITPEYLSRCEAGSKVMAPATEKLFRIYALLKTPDRAALEELGIPNLLDLIEIDSTWDVSEPLEFHFVRRVIETERDLESDGKWRNDKKVA